MGPRVQMPEPVCSILLQTPHPSSSRATAAETLGNARLLANCCQDSFLPWHPEPTMAFLSPAFYPEFEFEGNSYLTAQPLITNERVFYANISTLWVSEVIAHIK